MESQPDETPEEHYWTLDSRRAAVMNLAMIVLVPVGLFLFTGLAVKMRPAYSFSVVVNPRDAKYVILAIAGIALSPIIVTVLILLFHEWCHGLAFKWAGAIPSYGAKLVKRILPIFYTTSPGNWLTKRQYLIVALTPTLVVNIVGIVLMWPATILRYLLVLPLVVHFCGCVGDWWMAFFIIKLPAGTMIEDTQEGFGYL